jgi:hypothetical protein
LLEEFDHDARLIKVQIDVCICGMGAVEKLELSSQTALLRYRLLWL